MEKRVESGALDERTARRSGVRTELKRAKKSVVREYAEAFLFAIILTLFIRTFVVQAFRIPSGSMENTLLIGDFLFVNKFLYGAHVPFTEIELPAVREPRRGDVIVFRYPQNPRKDFIKRAVGLPGDKLEIKDKVVYINDKPLDEPYVHFSDSEILSRARRQAVSPPGAGNKDNYGPVTVPDGHLFMMGDNRDDSDDSRFWGFLDQELIKGKAILIYWSWDQNDRVLGVVPRPRFERIGDLIK
jgi:signal peptidase I